MTKVTIYHNPRCSKSRETLQLLRDHGIEPTIIEYLKEPPSPTRIKQLLKMLNMHPRDLMRRKDADYRAMNLDDSSLDSEALINAMSEHPVLIERPIVVTENKAALGRPPEKVLEIL